VLSAALAPLLAHPFVTRLASASPSPSPTGPGTPSPAPSVTSAADRVINSVLQTDSACTKDQLTVCGLVLRWTGHRGLGQTLEVVLGVPLRLLVIIAFGILIRRALHRVIDRLAERIANPPADGDHGSNGARNGNGQPRVSSMLTTRRQARARTLASVLSSATTALILIVVSLMALQELSLPITPLLASASVVGVALGLGAQSLVRDIVSGMFMIAEDQYGVGDVIDVGQASGSVESVGLRITRLRDVNGTVWYVRNGEIMRVGNQSQGWARAVLDVHIGLGEDLDRAEQVLQQTASDLRSDQEFGSYVLDEPEVWGVESLTTEGVLMRVVVKTQPLQQWTVARELRRRIKLRFDEDGIEMQSSPQPVLPEPEPARRPDATDAIEH
jgi:moderate conductance mechanosensitive channel